MKILQLLLKLSWGRLNYVVSINFAKIIIVCFGASLLSFNSVMADDILEGLKSNDAVTRAKTARKINNDLLKRKNINTKEAIINSLITLLNDRTPLVSYIIRTRSYSPKPKQANYSPATAAARALGRLGEQRAIYGLVNLFEIGTEYEKEAVIYAVGCFEGDQYLDLLLKWYPQYIGEVQEAIINQIMQRHEVDPINLKLYIKMMVFLRKNKHNDEIKRSIIRIAGLFKDPLLINEINDIIDKDDKDNRGNQYLLIDPKKLMKARDNKEYCDGAYKFGVICSIFIIISMIVLIIGFKKRSEGCIWFGILIGILWGIMFLFNLIGAYYDECFRDPKLVKQDREQEILDRKLNFSEDISFIIKYLDKLTINAPPSYSYSVPDDYVYKEWLGKRGELYRIILFASDNKLDQLVIELLNYLSNDNSKNKAGAYWVLSRIIILRKGNKIEVDKYSDNEKKKELLNKIIEETKLFKPGKMLPEY
ncbi:MAG: hypothetical protein FJ128_07820 [Deltaproteobacteria bacterium]|nr:hypothetical protein [Deltaproteobacteria bacterium]